MTDIYDRATEREEAFRADALQEQQRRSGTFGETKKKTWHDSARNCRVCDEPLTLERRKAMPGTQTCVECQTDLERSTRFHP